MVLRRSTLLLVAVAVLIGLQGGAFAQANETATGEAVTTPEPSYVVQVSPTLRIVDYRHDGERMIVELEAEAPALVQVTDVLGSISETGGAVRQESTAKTVPRGRSTIAVPAKMYRGLAAVSISARGGSVTLSERSSTPLIGGPWTSSDAQAAGAGVLVGSIVLTGGLGWRKVKGVGSDVRRLI